MRLLAISGSLRRVSSNTAVLRAAAQLVPEGVEVVLYSGLGELPHFNPDLEGDHEPLAVRALRRAIREADGLLICSPEYAHGVAGSLKNLLDWLVSGEEFVHKPLALINASPRASHAQAALLETVTTMSARVVHEACIAVPVMGRKLDEAGIVADAELSAALRSVLAVFVRAIADSRMTTPKA